MFKEIAATEPSDDECDDVDDNENDNNEENKDEDDNVEGNMEVDHGLRKSNKAILRGAKKKLFQSFVLRDGVQGWKPYLP